MAISKPDGSAAGGFAVSGVEVLGVLMLDTRFPRVLGDIGNPNTFACAVRYATVQGASPQRIVREHDDSLLQAFVVAGRALVAEGVTAIATSCGFLIRCQRELQEALPVPVWTSSLLLLPEIEATLSPAQVAGVVTVDASALGAEHLRCAGARTDTPLEGLAPGCDFQRTLLNDEATLDTEAAREATVAAALRLVARRPDVRAIVLECTNMPPYAHAVHVATGRPVHDVTSLIALRLPTRTRST